MKPISIYVHWPFCLHKCFYCDFNSHVAKIPVDHNAYLQAFLAEIDFYSEYLENRQVTSIFFGGGTPSLMHAVTIEKIIEKIYAIANIASDVEISMEANPTSVEASKLADFKSAGISRISLGIQSFNQHTLKFLGREHSAAEAKRALEIASATFNRVSLDIIYACPGQTEEDLLLDFTRAIDFGTSHISLYQLTIEERTKFYEMYRSGTLKPMNDDDAAKLYLFTENWLEAKGFHAYEVSNYAKSIEDHSTHNSTYWQYNDYLGIGPGAHGRVSSNKDRYATSNTRSPGTWLRSVLKHGKSIDDFSKLTLQERFLELLLMHLRLRSGLPEKRLLEETGASFSIFGTKLDELVAEGLIYPSYHPNIVPTLQGVLKLEYIISYLSVAAEALPT